MATAYINAKAYTMRAEAEWVEAFVVENRRFLYCLAGT